MADDMLEAALRALTDPAALMGRVVVAALDLIPAAEGSVVELVDGTVMEYAHTAGALEPFVGLRLQAKNSLSGLSVEMGSTLYCGDSETDSRVDREACRRVGARSLVCVPLRSATRHVGVLKVISATPRAFEDKDVETLAGLSSFITAAITAVGDLDASATQALAGSERTRPDDPGASAISEFMASVLRPGVADDLQAARRIQQVLEQRPFFVVHQPIFDLVTGEPVISEALTRFTAEPSRTPDVWFHEAWRVGLGAELELLTATAALEDLGRLPEGCRLAINCSPSLLEHPLAAAIADWPSLEHVVLEITEHFDSEDFTRTRQFLNPLRRRGLKVAMDDAGNGYSSLQRMIALAPDIIKLDLGLVRGLDIDPVRRSLATAIVHFARDVSAMVVAEGVETVGELEELHRLGIRYGQGFLMARPGPVEAVVAAPQIASMVPAVH
jgi:EAL domain-containing protein (putative c-di-GMP-specific phosphodiesterase class I)